VTVPRIVRRNVRSSLTAAIAKLLGLNNVMMETRSPVMGVLQVAGWRDVRKDSTGTAVNKPVWWITAGRKIKKCMILLQKNVSKFVQRRIRFGLYQPVVV
jgi:hypothetical protein